MDQEGQHEFPPDVIIGQVLRDYRRNMPPALSSEHPNATPEDILYSRMQSFTAYDACRDFFKALCTPTLLTDWASVISQSMPDGMKGDNSVYLYLRGLVETFITTPLNVEFECSLSGAWNFYPFGFGVPHLAIHLNKYHKRADVMSCFARMLIVEHAEDGLAPGHTMRGGSFERITADIAHNKVYYSSFTFNNLLESYFPRFQFVATLCMVLASHALTIDKENGVDYQKALSFSSSQWMNVILHLSSGGDDDDDDDKTEEMINYQSSHSVAIKNLLHTVIRDVISTFGEKLEKHSMRMKYLKRVISIGTSSSSSAFLSDEDSHLATIENGTATEAYSQQERHEILRMDQFMPHLTNLLELLKENEEHNYFTPVRLLAFCALSNKKIALKVHQMKFGDNVHECLN